MNSTDIDRLFIIIFVYAFLTLFLLYRRINLRNQLMGAQSDGDAPPAGVSPRGVSPAGVSSAGVSPAADHKTWMRRFYILAAIALALRIAFAGSIEGFHSDIACFKSWSQAAADNFLSIYDKNDNWFIDYPPGYMYVLLLLGKIREIFKIPSDGRLFLTLIKLPSILADIACGTIIYGLTGRIDLKSRRVRGSAVFFGGGAVSPFSERARLLIAAFYLFNPVVFFVSTIWGQVDSILALLILLAILSYLGERYYASGVFYALAVVLKPQGIIFLPVVFFMLLYKFLVDKDLRPALKMLASALAAAIIVILPFSLRHGPLWIISLYTDTLSGYMLASMNAFNFFALLGANWLGDSNQLFIFTFASWGMIAIVISTLLAGLFVFCVKDQRGPRDEYAILMGSALLIFSVVTFGHRMHERYFYPVLPLLLAACIFYARDLALFKADRVVKKEKTRPRRNFILLAYSWITFSGYLNILIVFSAFYTYTSSDFYGDNRIYIISALNVAAAVFLWLISFYGLNLRGLWNRTFNKIKKGAPAAIILGVMLFGLFARPVSAYALGGGAENTGQPIWLANPGFEGGVDSDVESGAIMVEPQDWGVYDYKKQYEEEPDISSVTVDTSIFHTGSASARIESVSANDIRLYQSIPVEPDSIYRISCWIKTESVSESGAGAIVSSLGVFAASDGIKGTRGDFEQAELFGRTGPSQTDLWVAVGLGGYSNESSGVAWFDDVTLEKLDAAPQGVNIQKFYTEESVAESESTQPNEVSAGARIISILAVMIILSVIVLIAMHKHEHSPPGANAQAKNVPEPGAGQGSGPVSKTGSEPEPGQGPKPGIKPSPAAKKKRKSAAPKKTQLINKNIASDDTAAAAKHKLSGLDRSDIIIVSIMTAVYLMIALIRLGGFKAPRTYWKPADDAAYVVFEFDGPVYLKEVSFNSNVIPYEDSESKYEIRRVAIPGETGLVGGAGNANEGGAPGGAEDDTGGGAGGSAEDGADEELLCTIEDMAFFEWKNITVNAPDVISVRFSAVISGVAMNEIAFWGLSADGKASLLPVKINAGASFVSDLDTGSVYNLIDEQNTVPEHPDILNSTYFDEIYFARTAYEYIHSLPIYETTHPPLGKIVIAFGILIFGMNPFGWRIMGTLAGAAIIPAMYIFAKKLFGHKTYAFCASFLMMFDFMLFAQTRLSTIDSYATLMILFMYIFLLDSFMNGIHDRPMRDVLLPLAISGLAFGLGVSVKWIALYAGAGIAFLFILGRVSEIRSIFGFDKLDMRRKRQRYRGASAQAKGKKYMSRLGAVSIACVAFFVLIPGIIYLLSYIPYLNEPGTTKSLFRIMLDNQKSMFDYHSKLTDTHPFESIWWKWPLDIKPIWYYSAAGLQYTQKASVASFGNPLIWWTGIPCLITAFILAYRRMDRQMAVVFTAFFFQYVPWMFVARATFIYHYFSSVPFMILTIVYIIKALVESKTISFRAVGVYFAAVALLFFIYYPILSGLPVTKLYSDTLRLFSTWLW